MQGGSESAGTQRTDHILGAIGHGIVVPTSVSVHRDATTARVEVAATTMSLLPFLPASVDAVAQAPLEP